MVKWQGGDSVKERSPDPSNNSQHTEDPPDGGSQGIKPPQQAPVLNPDPFQHWYGVENVARVRINGESCMALLDNDEQINTITPKYVSDHSLQMEPITDLLGARVTCVGLGNGYTRPLAYIVIRVQVDGVQGYDEDQIALVIPDLTNFAARIPLILGTHTISCIIKCDEWEGDWCLGQMPGWPISCRYVEWQPFKYGMVLWKSPHRWLWPGSIHPECGDYRSFLLLHGANVSGKGLHWRAYQRHGPGITYWRQLFSTGPQHTKYVHRAEAR